MDHWFLIQSKSCQEHKAADNLRAWTEVLLPLAPFSIRISKKLQPLYTGYLFARFPDGFIAKAEVTYGVARVVRFGLAPAVVDDELIEAIRSELDPAGVLLPRSKSAAGGGCGPKISHEFRRGDLVQVVSGPFVGLKASFDCSLNGNQRAYILLETLRQGEGSSARKPAGTARLQVSVDDLRKVI